jgi:hypothetical protein
MGADIHAVLQVQQPDGTWRTVGVGVYQGRNYRLFGHLAGVRGDAEPMVAPRGLPQDFEHRVELDKGWLTLEQVYHQYEDEQEKEHEHSPHEYYMGWHSHSYLTLAELQSAPSRVRSAVLSATDFDIWDKESDPEDDDDLQLLDSNADTMERAEYELRKAHGLLPRDPYTDELDDDVRVKIWYVEESPLRAVARRLCKEFQIVDPGRARFVFGFDN